MQADREIEVTTPLGADKLLFREMSGREQIGRLFEFNLELVSDDEAIKLEDLLGKPVTVRLSLRGDENRFFNGFVSRFSLAGRSGNRALYRATLRPWLWFLTRTSSCRIFQGKTVPDIVKQVLRDRGFTDFEESLSGSYRAWDYCVQYRETDFNFISRLLEQEGIYYYFKHEDGKHKLVFADGYGAHARIPGYETVPYHVPTERVTEEHVSSWLLTQEIQPGAYALNDFDFEKPKANLRVVSKVKRSHPQAEHEVYDYPGEYVATGEGDAYAKARIQELQWQYEQVRGVTDARGIAPGGLFELSNFPRDDQNREYLVVSADYGLHSDEYETGSGAEAAGPTYHCSFSAVDAREPYRTPRMTPKPMVQGPQTAIVVGKAGEEIWTDKYGRVKVQFHWDREGKSDENSSCWVRVSQAWAGSNWGGIHIPRIGQEVIVDFLEGDPDRPLITGRVYNADNMPPYALPANQTQSGIKSRSSKGGGGDNFNEIRFEDKKGSEELYLHAEKNHTNITENDRSEDVGHDRSLHVGHDKAEAVDNNKSITVGVNHEETIGANKTLTVGANHDEKVGANMTILVGSMLTETVAINYAETVGAAMELTIGAAFAETVGAAKVQTIGAAKTVTVGSSQSTGIGKDKSETVGGSKTVSVSKDLKETVNGAHSEAVAKEYSLKAKKVAIVADDEITIKTGSATIVMKKNGDITIDGKNINVKGSGNITMKATKILEN